ncbi:hypothetical protein [Sphingomonas sp. S-NIH.Pt15_0812]|nr:hypothetical protein [Sphingomonas sp. S-NIH.Pt15_0812]
MSLFGAEDMIVELPAFMLPNPNRDRWLKPSTEEKPHGYDPD